MYKDKRYNKYYGNLTLLTPAEVSVSDHLNIDKLYTLFYKSNGTDIIKEIPKNIGELLTPIALSIWIQDDGHFYHNGIFLNTNSYTKEGLGYLILAFDGNWGIKPEIRPVSGKANQFR